MTNQVLTENLVLQKAKVDDIKYVRNLNVWGMDLVDIEILTKLPNLQVCSLSVNKIESLMVFEDCQNLRELYLRKNKVSCANELTYLKSCKSLKSLWLSENPVACLKGYRLLAIKLLPNLVKLDDCDITNEERETAARHSVDSLFASAQLPDSPEPLPRCSSDNILTKTRPQRASLPDDISLSSTTGSNRYNGDDVPVGGGPPRKSRPVKKNISVKPPERDTQAEQARLRELQQQELEAREREKKARESREREDRERQLAKEQAIQREREMRDREAREREIRDREARERETRDREARERETRDREARERETRDREARERETRDREARERELRDRESREREMRERETREREAAKLREIRDREFRERDMREREFREREYREWKDKERRDSFERELHNSPRHYRRSDGTPPSIAPTAYRPSQGRLSSDPPERDPQLAMVQSVLSLLPHLNKRHLEVISLELQSLARNT